MMICFRPIQTKTARAYQQGNSDAYGLIPERKKVMAGSDIPCRHCLKKVHAGRAYLIVAHRPFAELNPYTETGPIFLCADECPAAETTFPNEFLASLQYIARGYSRNERIVDGTGSVIRTEKLEEYCEGLFTRTKVDFIHIRSASNNCFQCRGERIRK